MNLSFPKPKDQKRPRKKKNHVRRNKTRSKAAMVKALDAACRARVFERDGNQCQMCGSFDNLQWSHVLSRRHYCLRWDDQNSKVLCSACHCWWTYNPQEASYWFSKKFPLRWEYVNELRRKNPKVNVRELYEGL